MKNSNAIKSWIYVVGLLTTPTAALAGDDYLRAVDAAWQVKPLLSVGERAENGYAMVGIPDGLGAFRNDDGTFTLLMNHELGADKGIARAHGNKGAFVSRWVIDVTSLAIKTGEDLIKTTDPASLTFNRFCSADLAPQSAFYDVASGKGYAQRLFLNGEEDKAGGRAFAHALDGTSYQLPDLGLIAWENLLAHPASTEKTLLIGMDDVQDGLVLVYQGEKRNAGNPAELAGLMGGRLYAVKVDGARFSLVALNNAAKLDGKALRTQAKQSGATGFARPEDGAWDTRDTRGFYFATTDKIDGNSRLYRLVFDDIARPDLGGSIITTLQARDIGGQMFDNITVDADGRVLIAEDPGEDKHLAGIWLYDPSNSGKAKKVIESSPDYFLNEKSPQFMSLDEEQSGIVEVTQLLSKAPWFDIGRRYYLGVIQIHQKHSDPALVEYGQLYLFSGPKN
jgi:hypothetical protein